MKILVFSAVLLFTGLHAQCGESTFRLWPHGNPGDWSVEGTEQSDDRNGIKRVRGVNTPTIKYFAPTTSDPVLGKAAMIVCPGGGYSILAIDHEGDEVANWLSELGMHAFVLKYRLPKKDVDPSNWHVPVQDAQRAISMARQMATHLGYETGKIGIMGFSAGGHLTAATSNAYTESPKHLYSFAPRKVASRRTYKVTRYEPSSHPNFAALIYPAYLVGDEANQTLAPEVQVRSSTPPTFLVHTEDDRVTALSSLYYYRELKKAGVESEIHVFASGGHGYGMRRPDLRVGMWPDLMAGWMRSMFSE